jgi:hypothetical protein
MFMKTRDKLKFNAILSILIGSFSIFGIAVIYFKYGSPLCALILEKYPDTRSFVFAFKVFTLMLCPALSILLINLGCHILYCFKKESHDATSA